MLIKAENLSLSFGGDPVLDDLSFLIKSGERVGLIGRNGTGKSTLLKVLSNQLESESGEIRKGEELRISLLSQDVPEPSDREAKEIVSEGMQEILHWRKEYERLCLLEPTDEVLEEMGFWQERLDRHDGWAIEKQVEQVMSHLNIPYHEKMSSLSGGWRRRVMLAQALVSEPDILLLDEPTNHLDFLMIEWLLRELTRLSCAVLFITHDRAFMQGLATRIVELERGKLFSCEGSYRHFLQLKEQRIEAEEAQNAKLDKKLQKEEEWLKKGVKARRTRNEGRVRSLKKMREERAGRIEREGKTSFVLNESGPSGKMVAEMKKVSFSYDSKSIVTEFSYRLQRGDKIGLIGINGSGKSTFLKLLLGELAPQKGTVKKGANVDVLYYDQLREQLDEEQTVMENIGEGRDRIWVNGRDRHVFSYLSDFLFTEARMRMQVKYLSGGERNRLLLAKLFSQGANLFVLDEPTNDLDIESLELLEDLLANFDGTVLLVSHDREFLDNVVDSSLIFEEGREIVPFAGGYDEWFQWGGGKEFLERTKQEDRDRKREEGGREPISSPSKKKSPKTKRLSYQLNRELEEIPEKIERLEEENKGYDLMIADPLFYKKPLEEQREGLKLAEESKERLEKLIERWAELEEMKQPDE